MAKKIMLVGHGQMGKNHRKSLEALEKEGRAKIVSVVDIDAARLQDVDKSIAFTDIHEAMEKTKPDVAAVAASTAAHKQVIDDILEHSAPALFVEKPIAGTSEDAAECAAKLKELGYESGIPVAFAYLIRHSPALKKAVEFAKERRVRPASFSVVWQKKRKPLRPSPGVHIDETTHAIDAIVSYFLPSAGIAADEITLQEARPSYSSSVIDTEKQLKLYKGDKSMLEPMAEISYKMMCSGIPIEGISSFMREPFERTIHMIFENSCMARIGFDSSGKDSFVLLRDGKSSSASFYNTGKEKTSKVYLQWDSFLKYCETGKASPELANISSALFDLNITEALGRGERAAVSYPAE